VADAQREATLAAFPSPLLMPSSLSSGLKSVVKPSQISPQDLALALTMVERDRYQKINSSDCIGWITKVDESNSWITKVDESKSWITKVDESNEVSTFITQSNRLSYWVQKSILKPHEQSQRSENLKYFLCVAEVCPRILSITV
jgi:hypothetical protein